MSIGSTESLNTIMYERDSLGYREYPGTESDVYDFTAERHPLHSTNLIESTAHLIKGCLGAGILSIHVGFMYAGIWTAVASTLLIGLLLAYSMLLLVRSAHVMYVRLRIPKLSYPDLAEVSIATGPWKCLRKFSKCFRYFVDICLISEMCGSCCIYEIMIAKTSKQFFESMSTSVREADLHLRYYILIIAAPLILLSLIRNLKYLAPFSVAADIVIALCVTATVFYSLSGNGKLLDRPAWKNFDGFLRFCGICMYSMNGINVAMPIENNMKKPKYFRRVLQYGMSAVILMVLCTGFFGYWGWGESCISPINIHMSASILPSILQFLIALMLSVTFAVQFWVPFRVLWCYIGKKYTRRRGIWERVYRMLLGILITGLSIAFPNLIPFMVFVGNFFLALTAVIIPAFIESLATWKDHRRGKIRWTLLRNIIMIALGVCLWCGSFYTTIHGNISK